MKDVKAIVAKNLAVLRKQKGLTQAELAERFNYSDKAVSRWEHGDTLPDINVLCELCEFYDITMNDLVASDCSILNSEEEKGGSPDIYRVWLGILSAAVVWLLATVWFSYSILAYSKAYWLAFVWALPVSCALMSYVCRSIFGWITKFILNSVSVWSTIASMFLHVLVTSSANLWVVFLIGVPTQVLIFLWYKMKNYKKKL